MEQQNRTTETTHNQHPSQYYHNLNQQQSLQPSALSPNPSIIPTYKIQLSHNNISNNNNQQNQNISNYNSNNSNNNSNKTQNNNIIKASTIYPTILYLQRNHRQFLSQYSIPLYYKTLKNNDKRIKIFYQVICKLFKEISMPFDSNNNQNNYVNNVNLNGIQNDNINEGLNSRDLWICQKQNIGNGYPILVYFVQPLKYPIMKCCNKVVYIQFQHQINGKVKCSKCNKIGFSFVNISNENQNKEIQKQDKIQENKQNTKQQVKNKQNVSAITTQRKIKKKANTKHKNSVNFQHKQNNFLVQPQKRQKIKTQQCEIQIQNQFAQQKNNQKIYKYYKNKQQVKRQNIRKIISSNQHRYKSLKKVLNNQMDFKKKGMTNTNKQSKFQQNNQFYSQFTDKNIMQANITKNLYKKKQQNKKQVNIGQFIIQIQPYKSQFVYQNVQQPLGFNSNILSNIQNQQQNVNNRQNLFTKLDKNNKKSALSIHQQQQPQQNLSTTCKQIKTILLQLFS